MTQAPTASNSTTNVDNVFVPTSRSTSEALAKSEPPVVLIPEPGEDSKASLPSKTSRNRTLLQETKVLENLYRLHSSVNFWRKSTFDRPPPIWRKLQTVDSGLYSGAFPHVGGAITVKTDEMGFSFVLDARLCIRVLSLLNIDEHENTFEAILEVTLCWEVEQTQYDVCVEFWDRFRPRLHFENAVDSSESPEPIFWDESEPTENGSLMLRDDRDGRQAILRHFEYRKRTQRKFRQPLDLVHFPFDIQTLPITFYSERTFMYGRPFCLKLSHPCARDDFNEGDVADGAHVFEKDADCVDDMKTETLFALEGREALPELTEIPPRNSTEGRLRPRIDQYTLLVFVSRQYKSTMYNIYIPLTFMFVLSFLAFFIPPCAVVDRASVSLTLLLTTVALKTYMSDKLPSVPYLSAAENFLFYITVSLLIQSIMMAFAASSCFRYGAAGQFGFAMSVLEDDDDPSWDCGTDENRYDFWCANRRAPIQSLLDIVSIWVSVTIGSWTVFQHIFLRLLQMYNTLFEIHRYKFRSEYPELWGHFQDEDIREKQKRKVESRLCFFAIRHAEDTESCGLIRFLFGVLEETVFWRVHFWLAKLTERLGRPWWYEDSLRQPTSPESPSAWWRPFGVFLASPVRTMPKPEDTEVEVDTRSINRDEKMLARSPSSDPWSSEEYAARRKEATQFFARLFNRRALGYDNSQFYHGFRRPPWEKPTRSCHVLSRQRTEYTFGAGPLVSTNMDRRESRNVILFDCGTGETKPLLASVVDDYRNHQHRQFVVLRDKPGGPFIGRDEQPIEMHDYCRVGNTTSLITWMENHVNPTFSFAIAPNRSARHGGPDTPTNNAPETVDLVDILGFEPRISSEAERLFASRRKHKGWAPLWEVGEIIRQREPPHTNDGVRLLSLSEGMALVSVNGAPFDKEAAERCVLRARQLGRGFRNPRQFDRVEAMCAIGFLLVGRGTVADQESDEGDEDSRSRTWHRSTPAGGGGPMASSGKQSRGDRYSLGDSIMTATDSGITPDGIVLPGQRGVVLREHRSTDEDSVNVVYFVRWDNHPTLGDSMIKQRRYRKGLPLDTLKDAVIKPVAELHLDCICAAEPTEDGWEEPVVVVGTGAWFRNSRDRIRRNAHDMFAEIQRRHSSWLLERNTEFDEAWYEELSVRYVHIINKLHPPDAVLAVGNGSTQYSSIVVPDVRDRVVFKQKNQATGEPTYGVVASRYWMRDALTYKYCVFLEPPMQASTPREESPARIKCRATAAMDTLPLSPSSRAANSHAEPALSRTSIQRHARSQLSLRPHRPHRVVTAKANELVTLAADCSNNESEVTSSRVPHLVQLGNRRGKSFFECGGYTRDNVFDLLHDRQKQWYTHAKEVMRQLIRQDRVCKGTPAYVTCISACYYAAEFAGCSIHPNTTLAKDARCSYQNALNELITRTAIVAQQYPIQDESNISLINLTDLFSRVSQSYANEDAEAGTSIFAKKIKGLRGGSTGSTILSNLTYQIAIIDTLFDDATELRICRGWEIGDSYEFRTTWTSGWYLNWLRKNGYFAF